jgi:hypothetical protein
MKYVDVASDLEDHDIKDALDLHKIPAEILRTFGYLGPSGARVINQYIWENVIVPLGLAEPSVHDDSSVIDITDEVTRAKHRFSDESSIKSFAKEEEDDSVELVAEEYNSPGLVAKEEAGDDGKVSEDPIQLAEGKKETIERWQEKVDGEDSGEGVDGPSSDADEGWRRGMSCEV